jgi:tRNA G18 (ribose-2'-O)-methylase SpoU
MDGRNVTDDLKGKPQEEIRAILEQRRRPFGVLICNLQHDLNIGNIIRSANAFSATKVIIYGRKKYDRRGTVGTHHYENMVFARNEEDLHAAIEGYDMVAVDNTPDATMVCDVPIWPVTPMLVFGSEADGIAPEVLKLCRTTLGIPQTGSVRSLNVASAAAIMMYDLAVKKGWLLQRSI